MSQRQRKQDKNPHHYFQTNEHPIILLLFRFFCPKCIRSMSLVDRLGQSVAPLAVMGESCTNVRWRSGIFGFLSTPIDEPYPSCCPSFGANFWWDKTHLPQTGAWLIHQVPIVQNHFIQHIWYNSLNSLLSVCVSILPLSIFFVVYQAYWKMTVHTDYADISRFNYA